MFMMHVYVHTYTWIAFEKPVHWYLLICHRLYGIIHTNHLGISMYVLTRVWRVRETSWRRSNMEWITFRLHSRWENLGQQQQSGLTVQYLITLCRSLHTCQWAWWGSGLPTAWSGPECGWTWTPAVVHIAPVPHLEQCQQARRDKDCEVGGWDIRRKELKNRYNQIDSCQKRLNHVSTMVLLIQWQAHIADHWWTSHQSPCLTTTNLP